MKVFGVFVEAVQKVYILIQRNICFITTNHFSVGLLQLLKLASARVVFILKLLIILSVSDYKLAIVFHLLYLPFTVLPI